MRAGYTLDDFEIPVAHQLAPIGQRLNSIRTVSPDSLEPRNNAFQPRQESISISEVAWIGRVHAEQ